MTDKTRILVVEDDAVLRDALVQQLLLLGYEVDGAANGAVGLEKALIHRPDAVLFDFAMPVTDGPTLVEELRTLVSPMPVLIAISALSGAKQWCAEHGVSIFLPKPFGDETLKRTVVAAIDWLHREPRPEPPSERVSIRSACVVAVGRWSDDEVRRILPQSLQRGRLVVVESHEEAEKMLDAVIPELLVIEPTELHAKLRALAAKLGVPMLPITSTDCS